MGPVMPRDLTRQNQLFWADYAVPMGTLEARVIRELLGPSRGQRMRLLDVGCARGEFASSLETMGWESAGVDISIENAVGASQRGVGTALADLSSGLPFADAVFDAIVAKEIIEHVVDTRLLLQECLRILRPRGRLIVGTPNLASLTNRLRLLFGRYPGWMDFELQTGCGHVRYYTRKVLRAQLRSVGFEAGRELGTAMSLPVLGRFVRGDGPAILGLAGRAIPSLADIIVIEATKGAA
jgi:SAM-dependent methyltransferase